MTTRRSMLARIAFPLVAAVTLTTVSAVTPAAADVSGVVITGRGQGHGIGMSQWGARGRADAGILYPAILSHYYPGTTLATTPDTDLIRVRVNADTDGTTTVLAEPSGSSLQVRGAGTPITLPTTLGGKTPSQWRLIASGTTGLTVQARVDSGWVTYTATPASRAEFLATDGTVRLVLPDRQREYKVETAKGEGIQAVNSEGSLRTVVLTTFANYLPSVVTSEMPSSWHLEALKAQAVAARTYSRFELSPSSYYDICDTDACQVFNGIADYSTGGVLKSTWVAARTQSAVTDTAGRYLSYAGKPAFTQFSASNGGYSVTGSQPYLVAAADPYDKLSSWKVTLSAGQVESTYPSIGVFQSMSAKRDGRGDYGGRITSITIIGSAGSTTVSGSSFRSTFRLPSNLFAATRTFATTSPQRDLTADGIPDLLSRNLTGGVFRSSGRGNATFGPNTQIGNGWGGIIAVTSAFNLSGDNRTEVIAAESTGRLYSYPTTATGTLGTRRQLAASGWNRYNPIIAVSDFDGAGTNGLVARDTGNGNLYYFASTGTGGLAPARLVSTGWAAARLIVAGGDWNRDGRSDLMAKDSAGALWVYPGNGTGGLQPRRLLGTSWASISSVVGDTDWTGDGAQDLIATDTAGVLWLYPTNGAGVFLPRRQLGTGWASLRLVG